jgi:hypothetical protein
MIKPASAVASHWNRHPGECTAVWKTGHWKFLQLLSATALVQKPKKTVPESNLHTFGNLICRFPQGAHQTREQRVVAALDCEEGTPEDVEVFEVDVDMSLPFLKRPAGRDCSETVVSP